MTADKIFVGVHGIGDQVEYQTVQYVIERVTAYFGEKGQVPLGKISSGQTGCGVYEHPDPAAPRAGFAEVYWADLPRGVVRDGYTLEETSQWARHLVDKLDRQSGGCLAPADRRAVKSILPEVIESIDVLKRLLTLAEWGGKFKFNLKWVLDSFMGDVQLVAEFDQIRKQILGRFHSALEKAHSYNPDARIYLIAHSEGSVIAFLGLLEAMAADAPWVSRVKGLMTIGSPIDKHLILWPELWRGLTPKKLDGVEIPWCNYCDRGDPVGYELDAARHWLGGNSSLYFMKDVLFSRYLFPGKAHLDYWTDSELFSDFLSSVKVQQEAAPTPVSSKPGMGAFSAIIPYLFSLAILAFGVFIFYNAITICIGHTESAINLALNTAALTALLGGIAVAGRIPRLVRDLRYHVLSLVVSALCCVVFYYAIRDEACYWLAEQVPTMNADPRGTLVAIAAGIVLLSYINPLVSDRSGSRFFIFVGALVAIALALAGIFSGSHGDIMPVLIAGGMFLYLWWLSVIVLDLTFVWHRYIRGQAGLQTMRECSDGSYLQPYLSRTVTAGRNSMAAAVQRVRGSV